MKMRRAAASPSGYRPQQHGLGGLCPTGGDPQLPWAAAAGSAPPKQLGAMGSGRHRCSPRLPNSPRPTVLPGHPAAAPGLRARGPPPCPPRSSPTSVPTTRSWAGPHHPGWGQLGWGRGGTASRWDSTQRSRPVEPHKIPHFPVGRWAAPTRPEHGAGGHTLGRRDGLRVACPSRSPSSAARPSASPAAGSVWGRAAAGREFGSKMGVPHSLADFFCRSLPSSPRQPPQPFRSRSPSRSRSLPCPLCPRGVVWYQVPGPASGCCRVGTHAVLCCAEMSL